MNIYNLSYLRPDKQFLASKDVFQYLKVDMNLNKYTS